MELALADRRKAALAAGAAGLVLFVAARRAAVTAHRVLERRPFISGAAGGFGGADKLQSFASARAASPGALEASAPEAVAGKGFDRKMIREGNLTIEVAGRGEARGRALEAARRLGADVLSDESAEGDDGGAASMTFAIDSARLPQLIEALTPLGRVLTRATSSEDVTEEWVDLDSRLANAKAVRARLEELLRFKTTKLADVVLVERELERVGAEVEQMEGRKKYLAARTERARLCVRFQQPPKLVSSSAGVAASLRDGFASAFSVFAATALALLQLAGFVLGLALWTAPVSWLGWKAWKRWGAAAKP
ncbi:MAG TPA: DUF4349 domain-containing protein [Elusimicrobiota bacterium]|nr:DUF4349 domain-containing protein [Elusimicrobiota bacterium]